MQKILGTPFLWSATALLLVGLLAQPLLASNGQIVQQAEDLSSLGRDSSDRHIPIVLMFSSRHCEYCERLEAEFLVPMKRSGEYEDKALIRKLDLDRLTRVVDFNGEKIDAEALADRYDVDVTPTVVFLDHQGRQLAKRLIGLGNVFFYGGLLDEAIEIAHGKLHIQP